MECGEGEDGVETEGGEEEEDDEERPTLRVGAFCAVGKRRSVAFVEELARRKWLWEVRVEHRDLSKRRGGNEEKKRGKGKGLRYVNGEDSDAE